MSNRYVWDIYDTKSIYKEKISASSGSGYTKYTNYTYWGAVGTGYTFDSNHGTFSLTGYNWRGDPSNINAQSYPYLVIVNSNTSSSTPTYSVMLYNGYQSKFDEPLYWTFWYRTTSGTAAFYNIALIKQSDLNKVNASNYTSYAQLFYFYQSESTLAQGNTKTGNVSSSSSTAYPSNGIGTTTATKNNWYLYKGYDTIDLDSLTYDKTELNAGDRVTVKASPTSPKYGGTVYYLYQYSIDGTTWTNIGNKTTSTSTSITIPTGAKQFQARALASDAWGFTSSTYVYGPTLGVQQLKAYYGVNAKARTADKFKFGVNSKVREVVAAYYGVNGKARKVL